MLGDPDIKGKAAGLAIQRLHPNDADLAAIAIFLVAVGLGGLAMRKQGEVLLRALSEGLAFLGRIDAVEANFVLNFGRVEEGEGVAIGNRDDSTLQLSEFSSGMG